MGVNSEYLNEDGEALCISCRRKFKIFDLENCVVCERFVCKKCATYRRQGDPYGYVCKRCLEKLKSKQ